MTEIMPKDTIPLKGRDEFFVGRSASSDIRLNTGKVSSNHAVLRKTEGGWLICDNDSTNGTIVNGAKIRAAQLRDGDEIRIGGWALRYSGETISIENAPDGGAALPGAPYPYFQKSPRIKPEPATAEVELLMPPSVGSRPVISWLSVLLPPLAMVAVMGTVAAITGNAMMLIYTAPMSMIGVLVGVINYRAQTKKWREGNRLAEEKYAQHLKEREADIFAAESAYFNALCELNPDMGECMRIVSERLARLWERSVCDDDFLAVRIGTGKTESNVTIKMPHEQLSIEENTLLPKAREVKARHTALYNIPVVNDFAGSVITGVSGGRGEIIKIIRSTLVSVAALHSYEDVKIVCIYPEGEKKHWDWVRWLPHVWNDERTERFVACSASRAGEILRGLEDTMKARRRGLEDKETAPLPWYFVVLADKALAENSGASLLPESRSLGVAVLYAYGETSELPTECNTIIECGQRSCALLRKSAASKKIVFRAENVRRQQADDFARSLAPVRLRASKGASAMPSYITFMQGLGAGKVEELNILGRWNNSRPYDSLAVPIGIRENGEVFYFDINDKAMGAHGLVAGTSGWGKSELLTTFILSVALSFRPDEVNFILIDFKGDGLGQGLMELPHVAGKISNIQDIGMIDRNLRSLNGELLRRQRLFASTGLENIHKYQNAYRSGQVSEPLPYLLMIVDEFAEMKEQFPDKMNDIVQTARIGRSLGVYMTLATQSPNASIVSGQIDANARFRICLKTARADESKAIIGTGDAFNITSRGRAIIKVGNNEIYEQIQTFYTKSDYAPSTNVGKGSTEITDMIYVVETDGRRTVPCNFGCNAPEVGSPEVGANIAHTSGPVAQKLGAPLTEGVAGAAGAAGASLTEGAAVSNYINAVAAQSEIPKARQVWTEPLPESLALGSLLSGREAFAGGRWNAANSGFALAAGYVDDPDNQRQYPFVLDFAANGHAAIYGAPSTGKTTLLQTLLMSAAYTYTPAQAEFILFDFGNYALRTFEGLPHTRSAADSGQREKISETEEYMLYELERRKQLFASQGAGTIETYCAVSGDNLPYILVVVDNMHSLANQMPDLVESLTTVARDGGNLGMYLVVTAGNQGSFMYRIAQYIKTSIALNMTDKSDYRQLVGGNGKQEPQNLPGRGFIKGPLEFQAALFAGGTEAERILKLRDICKAMQEAWTEPTREAYSHNAFDFGEMRGCVISGQPQSGKTNVLLRIAHALMMSGDTRLYIFDKTGAFAAMFPMAKVASSGSRFDDFALEIAEEYDKRAENDENPQDADTATQDGETATQGADTATQDADTATQDAETAQCGEATMRLAIIIDGFGEFFDEIADSTADLLGPIINYGEEYGIYTYIAGNSDELTRLRFGAMPLANALSLGRGIALGGRLKEHAVFDGLYKSDDITLSAFDACVIREGKASRVKITKWEGGAANA